MFLACCLTAAAWAKPTLFIIGDSTVRNQTAGQEGWGDPLVAEFDPAKIEVVNRAIGGRSSRTFLTEGRWDAVMANLKAGDYQVAEELPDGSYNLTPITVDVDGLTSGETDSVTPRGPSCFRPL